MSYVLGLRGQSRDEKLGSLCKAYPSATVENVKQQFTAIESTSLEKDGHASATPLKLRTAVIAYCKGGPRARLPPVLHHKQSSKRSRISEYLLLMLTWYLPLCIPEKKVLDGQITDGQTDDDIILPLEIRNPKNVVLENESQC
ncbi:hypothetical protein EVAR_50561_1 [Eumeta japonica]|uniref:Uncharacterized protein n=1 Tax=Eumeta variegata TaxID=151549 RepID=A0A4C1ZG42_EUMVA|nr:hypothetical protein EVAR_50561_1 [Eumeta japonica]